MCESELPYIISRHCAAHCVEICKFSPTIFCKNSVKLTFHKDQLYCKSIWRKIFVVGEKFPKFPARSVEISEILSHRKKFREINSLVIHLVRPLLSRNFCQKSVRENFRNFHTVQCEKREILSHWKKLRQINYLVISLVKPLVSRNVC